LDHLFLYHICREANKVADMFVKYDLWMTHSNDFFDVISGFAFLASMANMNVFAGMTPSFYKRSRTI